MSISTMRCCRCAGQAADLWPGGAHLVPCPRGPQGVPVEMPLIPVRCRHQQLAPVAMMPHLPLPQAQTGAQHVGDIDLWEVDEGR